jgi:hypothetical protein
MGKAMGKGAFVNHKLGKTVSHKVELVKSKLSGQGSSKSLRQNAFQPAAKQAACRENFDS